MHAHVLVCPTASTCRSLLARGALTCSLSLTLCSLQVQLLLGRLPTPALIAAHGLQQYEPIIAAMRRCGSNGVDSFAMAAAHCPLQVHVSASFYPNTPTVQRRRQAVQ